MKITSVRVRTMVWVMVPQTAGSVMLSKDANADHLSVHAAFPSFLALIFHLRLYSGLNLEAL